jgi:uncharacterized protein (TIGR02145 family)
MIRKAFLLTALMATYVFANAQEGSFLLSFSALINSDHLELDSIQIINQTQNCETALYWPDTVIDLSYMGIKENSLNAGSFKVSQNYPNPVREQCDISIFIPGADNVGLTITDFMGRVIYQDNLTLETGKHSFTFIPGQENFYILTAVWKGKVSSIKILNLSTNANRECKLKYNGNSFEIPFPKLKSAIQDFTFTPGDSLIFIGYTISQETGIIDRPTSSKTYIFQFATNLSCPGMPTVTYEGQVYHTVQVFSQCWIKENLNVGVKIPGMQEMNDNGIIEKYCYFDEDDSCSKYGGLYTWREMMLYTSTEGARGICPSGWHIPTDEEWNIVEGSVDSQFGINDPEWKTENLERGYDAGINLKSDWGWNNGGNGQDANGFYALPAGNWNPYTSPPAFSNIGVWGMWWTSTQSAFNAGWHRLIGDTYDKSGRYSSFVDLAISVRCLKDY